MQRGAGLTEPRGTHPCYAEPDLARRGNSYYYSFNGSTKLALGTDGMLPGTTNWTRFDLPFATLSNGDIVIKKNSC